MNERQRFAFEKPCRTEAELHGFGYRVDEPYADGIITSHLSIRLFDGTPAWHCSIGFCTPNFQALPTAAWSDAAKFAAVQKAITELDGVGDGKGGQFQQDQYCFRFRRPLNGNEMVSLERGIEYIPPPPPPAAQFYVVDVNAQ